MAPDKRMGLHWFFSRITAAIGMVLNGIMVFANLSLVGDSAWYLADVLFAAARCWACIGMFVHRKEYSPKEYKYCNFLWITMLIYSALAAILNPDVTASMIGQAAVAVIALIYYAKRSHIFNSGLYVYTDGKTPAALPAQQPVDAGVYTPAAEAEQPGAEEAPVSAETPESPKSVYCSNCGNQLMPGAKFCNNCGAKIE